MAFRIGCCLLLLSLAWSSPTPGGPASAEPDADWQKAEAAHLKNIKQLTFDFVRAGEGYFSPDGRHIIFQAEEKGENPFYQIYIQELETGKHWRVSPGVGRTTCAYFHPTEKRVLWASSHLDPDAKKHQAEEIEKREEDRKAGRRRPYEWVFDEHMDIFESDWDGGNLKRLTDAKGYDAEGSYSADGKKIVFCSNRDGDLHIYLMDRDGKNVRQVTRAPQCYNGGPFLSPDGSQVIFRADRKEKGQLQIYVIKIDGSDERQLTDIKGVAWAPYWHPDGKHIVYTAAEHRPNERPNYDVWLMNVETGKQWRLTHAPGQDVLPVFSPDGKKLMWSSTRDGKMAGTQLFIADFLMPEQGK